MVFNALSGIVLDIYVVFRYASLFIFKYRFSFARLVFSFDSYIVYIVLGNLLFAILCFKKEYNYRIREWIYSFFILQATGYKMDIWICCDINSSVNIGVRLYNKAFLGFYKNKLYPLIWVYYMLVYIRGSRFILNGGINITCFLEVLL